MLIIFYNNNAADREAGALSIMRLIIESPPETLRTSRNYRADWFKGAWRAFHMIVFFSLGAQHFVCRIYLFKISQIPVNRTCPGRNDRKRLDFYVHMNWTDGHLAWSNNLKTYWVLLSRCGQLLSLS